MIGGVTDHAVLRYLQRVRGLNVDEIRRHIANLCDGAAKSGAVSVAAEGVRFVLARNGTVITVNENAKPTKPNAAFQNEWIRR